MRLQQYLGMLGLSVAMSVFLTGCAENSKPSVAENEAMDADHEHDGHDHADHGHASSPEATLASLSQAEQKIAKAQDLKCIVSDEPLGSMGQPVVVKNVDGHDFLICCAGCEEELRAHPEKYIAKLEKIDHEQPVSEPPAESAIPENEEPS